MKTVSFGMTLTFGMALRNQNLTSGYVALLTSGYTLTTVKREHPSPPSTCRQFLANCMHLTTLSSITRKSADLTIIS